MDVRPLAAADLEAALDLFEAVAAEGRWLATEAPVDRRAVRARWLDLAASGEGELLVAVDEAGAVLGVLALVGRETPELGMAVRADRRRRGVGDALVRGALGSARARGARSVVLQVFAHNTAAVALYRKHGFVPRGLVPGGVRRRSGERWDALVMERDLGSAQRGASDSSR